MKLKVGLFNESFPPTIDGVANAVFNYAKYIQKNHGTATVVTPKYPNVEDNYDFEVYRYQSADVSKSLGYRVGNMFSMKTLRDLYQKDFDLIHIHSPFTSSVIVSELKKLRADIPVVVTYHTKFDIEFQKRLKVKSLCDVAEKFLRHNLSEADEVWVVSEGAVESLRNVGYKGPYRIMKNGTDFERGKSSNEEVAELRQEYGILPDEKLFLFVGRMMWYKNIGLIIDALKQLPDDMNYKMLFVGDGNDLEHAREYVRRIGLSDRVVFAGGITDRKKVRTCFSAADLFLFPSTYDTAGLVVMEAAACSLPSVLVDGSCAAEDVVDDFSGYLCNENAKSLADKIIYAMSDDEKRRTIGENASRYVYLSWEDSVARGYKRYCELYNEFHKNGAKKSIIEKTMPKNLKKSITTTVSSGGKIVKRVGVHIKTVSEDTATDVINASKKAVSGVKSFSVKTAGDVKNATQNAADNVKNAVKRAADSTKEIFKSNDIINQFKNNDK